MKEKLSKLIDVKSIITITLTAVFAVLSATGSIDTDAFLSIFQMIVVFYFGTQYQKSKESV